MDTKHLIYIAKIVETGSINKAADQLFISYPNLRNIINILEQELNAPLFVRTRNGCVPTELCSKIVAESHIILDCIDSWKNYSTTSDFDTINIAASRILCDIILSPVIPAIKQKNPFLHINIKSATIENIILNLQQKNFSLAIFFASSFDIVQIKNRLENYGFRLFPFFESKPTIYLNKLNPLVKKDRIWTDDLKDYFWINLSEADNGINTISHEIIKKLQPSMQLNNASNILKLIAQSPQYYSLLSSIQILSTAYTIYSDAICYRYVQDLPVADAKFYLAFKESDFISIPEQMLVDMLIKHMKNIIPLELYTKDLAQYSNE